MKHTVATTSLLCALLAASTGWAQEHSDIAIPVKKQSGIPYLLTNKIDVSRFRNRFGNGDAELKADFYVMVPGFVTRLARELRDGIDPKP